MCLSGAVVEQNSKSIKQLVHPSPWLSPGKIYWLRQQPGHTGTSSFLCGWLDTEGHTGPGAWDYHGAEACYLRACAGGNMKVCSHFTCQRGLTFSTCFTAEPPALEALLWNSSSFLSNSDWLIFSEIFIWFYMFHRTNFQKLLRQSSSQEKLNICFITRLKIWLKTSCFHLLEHL